MKRLIQLVPRLSGVGAALFAGSALAAQMYLNPLAGNTEVGKGIYGAVEADAEAGIEAYAGLILPAPIAASYVGNRSNIPTTSPGISGAFTNMLGNGTNKYVATHTVAGWFKVASLPTTSGSYTFLWIARNDVNDNDHAGYGVAVDPDGKLMVGRYNSRANTLRDSLTSSTEERRLITTDGVMSGNTWTHIAVSFSSSVSNNIYTTTVKVFVNGVEKSLKTNTSFKSNLNGTQKCQAVQLGTGVSAAGFYVDDRAITEAATVQALAVDPTKHIYAAQWTRNVPEDGEWLPTSAGVYPWSADGMTLTSTNPLVYRGSVTLSVTATDDSNLSLNASPSLTALTTDYGTGGTAVLTLSSGENTLTAATTTISAKTVLYGTGFALGNLSITSTGSLSVGENRNFTLASVEKGGKLSLTPTAAERLAGAITLQMGETATLTAEQVEVADYDGLTVSEGTISLVPVWRPTNTNSEWSDTTLWSGGTVPDRGNIVIDFSGLTKAKTVEILNGTFSSVTFTGNAEASECALTLSLADDVTLGAMTINGRVSLPVTAVKGATSVLAGAQLTLSGTGTLSGTDTPSQNITGAGTVALAANAEVTLRSAGVLANTLTITVDATSAISTGAFIPSCNLTNAGWQGTFKFTANLPGAQSGDPGLNMNWSTLGNANSKVVIPSGITITGYFNSNPWTLAAAVELNGTIDLTNGHSGSSGNTYTFAGALTGAGTFKHTTTSNPTNAVILQNASGFDGTLTIAGSINRTFIIGTAHAYSKNNDTGKIIITGPVKASALRTWTAANGLVFEGAELDGGESGIELDQKIVTNAGKNPLTIRGKVKLTDKACTFNGPVTVAENGSLTWEYSAHVSIAGKVTLEEGATFTTVSSLKYALTLTGELAGAGTIRIKVPTGDNQNDGARFLYLNGACANFTGTVELELTTGESEGMKPRRTSVQLQPSDNRFGGSIDVVKVSKDSSFRDTPTAAVTKGSWPYSCIFFANACQMDGTIGGQGRIFIGRTGDYTNTDTTVLTSTGAPSTTAGAVTLKGTLGEVVTTNGDTTATFAGQIFVAGEDTTAERVACPAASVAFTTTTKQVFSGALTGAGWKTFGVEGSAGTFEVSGTFGEAVAGDPDKYAVKHTGGITIAPGSSLTLAMTESTKFAGSLSSDGKPGAALVIASGKSVALSAANGNYSGTITVEETATLSNAGSSQAIPFGKGSMTNNGTVNLMGSNGILPFISGSGDITFCTNSVTYIASEIITTGTVTFEGKTSSTASDAAQVTFVSSNDFPRQEASIEGASVVVGEGVTLAKDETSTPLITIAAGRSLSGTGTINVPVTFENNITATMASNANITFGSTLTVPKNVTLPGTITLGEGAVLSGAGALSGTVTLNSGVIIDATESTASGYLKLTGSSVTLGDTLKVKVASLTNILDLPTTAGLTLEKVQLTDSTLPTGAKLMTSVFVTESTSITTLKFFVPPTVPAPAESPRDSGVDAAIAKAAESSAGLGMIISEVTAITATGSDGTGTRNVDGASLFENVLTLELTGHDEANGSYTATATVGYDFGVSAMTVKSARLGNDTEAQRYVVLCAKVSNGTDSGDGAAAYGTKTTVSLLLGDKVCDGTAGNGPAATELTDDQLTAMKLTRGAGEKWFAVPMSTLGTGTHAFTVEASKTAPAN